MFNNIPFGYSNNYNPYMGFNGSPYNNFGGYNGLPYNGWDNYCFGGFGFPGYNFSNGFGGAMSYGQNWNSPFNGFNNWNGAQGFNSWNSMPFSGYNNWNNIGFGGQFNAPLAGNAPYAWMNQGAGFPGMNWNSAWMGSNSPWMNWGSYFPGSVPSQFVGSSPVSGISNWFSSPWMGYAYPNYNQQNNTASNGKVNAPVNGQYIPNGAFPFPCAPFNVPFPANGYAGAGQGVNCEAA